MYRTLTGAAAAISATALFCSYAPPAAAHPLTVGQSNAAIRKWLGKPLPGGSIKVSDCHRARAEALNCRLTIRFPVEKHVMATVYTRVSVRRSHGKIHVASDALV